MGYKKLIISVSSLMILISSVGCSNTSQSATSTVEPTSVSTVATTTIEPTQITEASEPVQEEVQETSTPEVTVEPTSTANVDEVATVEENIEETPEEVEEEYLLVQNDELELTEQQRNSINMLNYMSVIAQKINVSSSNQLFLESAYSSLSNNTYPNAIDTDTQTRMTELMDSLEEFRMIAKKRERLQYIYEQNKAQALKQAIPSPLSIMNIVQSKNYLDAAISVLYMAVDSASSYASASSQADMQFIQDGWELDDEESAALHKNILDQMNYLIDIVRKYNIPGDYTLNNEDIEDFVSWSNKTDKRLTSKIEWFETHESKYQYFGSYWLELAKDYYNDSNYEKCLDSINEYEKINTRIYRKNIDYANVLPMVILSAKEVKEPEEYKEIAEEYCKVIENNTNDSNWDLRYFVAQIYMDLYNIDQNEQYLNNAYKIILNNVNNLVEEQTELNSTYLNPIVEVKAEKDAAKSTKNEIKNYNKLIKEERKIALPPVSEALYLNCELLFALADKINVSSSEKKKIDKILHGNGEVLFLTESIDNQFYFTSNTTNQDDINFTYSGDEFTIPANYVADRTTVKVTVKNNDKTTVFEDYAVEKVKRPKNSIDCSEFTVTYKSDLVKKYKFADGDVITIEILPTGEENSLIKFTYKAVVKKKLKVMSETTFEKVEQ